MSTEDLHEVEFKWPHPEPNTVIVTGTFDDWSCSIYLTKTPAGFEGTTKIPWGEKIKFKFVVDGKWIVHENQPTEVDPGGFVNNIYSAPPHPSNAEVVEPAIEDVQPITNGHLANGHTLVAKVVENPPGEPAGEPAAGDMVEDEVVAEIKHQATDLSPPGFPPLLSDLASTIAARDGTSSALDYVASGLGAAMHGVVGMDPINTQKIAIPTPVSDHGFTLGKEPVPVSTKLASDCAPPAVDPDIPVSPFAPRVPITIVPVNAAENNTVSSSAEEISSPIPIIDAGPAGPAIIITEPFPTPIKSETNLALISPAVEADAPSVEVEQEKAIETEMPTEDTVAIPVLLEINSPEPETLPTSTGPEPTLSVAESEPLPATEPVVVPVAAGPAVEPETTTAAEAISTTAEVESAAPTEADVPPATKTQPEAPMTTESIAEPKTTPATTEPVPATTDAVTVTEAPTTEFNVEVAPLIGVPEAEDASAVVVEEPLSEELAVEVDIVKDETLTNETLAPKPTPPTGSPIEATAAEQVKVTDTPAVVKGEKLKADEVVEPTPTAVTSVVEVPAPLAPNEPEPSPVVDEVTLMKEHGHTNGTTTDQGARKETSTNGHGATTSTQEAATLAKKFPSTSTSPPVSEDSTSSPSKFSSTRKKRTSIFGKLKNIFHHDKEKGKN